MQCFEIIQVHRFSHKMISPFADNPLIREFNEIKDYFRSYETDDSINRVTDFRNFARLIEDAGYRVAFDFVGSVNFGLAEKASDVDFVLYIECENGYRGDCDAGMCHTRRQVESLLVTSLMKGQLRIPYQIQVVDCINLFHLADELDRADPESPVLFRFAFYRSICRNVNGRLMRQLQVKLMRNKELLTALQGQLDHVFGSFNRSSQHHLSFEKYRSRLQEVGADIPESMLDKIRMHLKAGAHIADREINSRPEE